MSELQKPNAGVAPVAGNENPAGSGGNGPGDAGKGVPSITIPEKRGRGRPRKDGSSPAPAAAKRSQAIDPELAGVIVTTLIQLIRVGDDLWAKKLLGMVSEKIPPDVRQKFADGIRAASFNERDEKILTPILTAIVLKYDIFARMGPEALALLWLGQYGVRMYGVTVTITKAAEKFSPEKPKDGKEAKETKA